MNSSGNSIFFLSYFLWSIWPVISEWSVTLVVSNDHNISIVTQIQSLITAHVCLICQYTSSPLILIWWGYFLYLAGGASLYYSTLSISHSAHHFSPLLFYILGQSWSWFEHHISFEDLSSSLYVSCFMFLVCWK